MRSYQDIEEDLRLAYMARRNRLGAGGVQQHTHGENSYLHCSMTELRETIKDLEEELRYAGGDPGYVLVALRDDI